MDADENSKNNDKRGVESNDNRNDFGLDIHQPQFEEENHRMPSAGQRLTSNQQSQDNTPDSTTAQNLVARNPLLTQLLSNQTNTSASQQSHQSFENLRAPNEDQTSNTYELQQSPKSSAYLGIAQKSINQSSNLAEEHRNAPLQFHKPYLVQCHIQSVNTSTNQRSQCENVNRTAAQHHQQMSTSGLEQLFNPSPNTSAASRNDMSHPFTSQQGEVLNSLMAERPNRVTNNLQRPESENPTLRRSGNQQERVPTYIISQQPHILSPRLAQLLLGGPSQNSIFQQTDQTDEETPHSTVDEYADLGRINEDEEEHL